LSSGRLRDSYGKVSVWEGVVDVLQQKNILFESTENFKNQYAIEIQILNVNNSAKKYIY